MGKKLIVLSGCSGGGKSTLLDELGKNGHTVMPEAGREIVKEQLAIKGGIMPWQSPQAFCELIIARSVEKFHQAAEAPGQDGLVFFDRSFLDGVAGYQSLKIADSGKIRPSHR
ncbi:MAG: AAA family ATPase [Alphaproteobacteria bacterium]